jgi:SAM-dependent methyltransferase
MVSNSQLKRVPGVQKAYQFARAKLHPSGYEHWLRVVMNQETARLVGELDFKRSSALEISGLKWKDFGFARFKSVGYPEYDVCAGTLADKFDVIIAEQVFEHVLWPYRGVRNVFEMLNPNGAFLITTPFLVRIHGHPIDCSRWSELGMRHLLAEGGFNIDRITTGSWGNRACLRSNLLRWTPYNRWLHSLKNEPDYPVQVWALARK